MTGNHVGCNSPRGFESPPFRSLSFLALAAASLFVLFCSPAQYLGRQQDDIFFVLASHALSQGDYRLFTTPGQPALTMVAPGLPFLLLPVTWLAGESFILYQIFCALMLAALPWLLWAWLSRRADEWEATLICLLFTLSPLVLSQAGTVMSEIPYTLGVLLLLLILERPLLLKAPLAGSLLMGLILMRPAGLSLMPAALARPIKEKRWKDAAWTLFLPGMGALAWSLWSYSKSGSVQELSEFSVSYHSRVFLPALAVAADNFKYFLTSWGSSYLPKIWGEGPAALALGAALSALSLAGTVRLLRQDPCQPAALMLGAAVLMHGVFAWHYERYLIPVLPWLLWTAALALGRKSRRVLAALFVAQLGFHSTQWLGKTSWSEPELAETYQWLKTHGTGADILASPLYVRDGFYAARPSLPLPDAVQPEKFLETLKKWKARHVLWQDNLDIGVSLSQTSAIEQALDRAEENLKDGRRYRLIYENRREQTKIYEIR